MNVARRHFCACDQRTGDTAYVITHWKRRPIAAMTAAPAAEPVFEVVQDDYARLPEWFSKTGAGQWNAIPDAVWEKLGRCFPLITIRVYCAIAKQTWGTSVRQRGADGKLIRDVDGKVVVSRREWCEEPQDEIKRRLGVGKSTVAEAIAQLTRYKLTIRQENPSDRRRARYKNDLYALLAFDAETVEEDDAAAEAATPAASKTASPLRVVEPHEPLVLLPGEKNRPFTLGTVSGRISNATAAQVAVTCSMLEDGEIDFAICDLPVSAMQEKPEGEKKANPIGAQQVTEKIHPENRMYSASGQAQTAVSGSGENAPGKPTAAREMPQRGAVGGAAAAEGEVRPVQPSQETQRPWIDVERDPDFARFTAVISPLAARLHCPPPALAWRKQEFARLVEAGIPLGMFLGRFKLRSAALTSYGGVSKLIDDVISARSLPEERLNDSLVSEYERYREQAREMGISEQRTMTFEEYHARQL